MSALTVLPDWIGTLEAFVELANDTLPHILPFDKTGRAKDEVNARLVRHYTTQGLLDEPLKSGREARYTRRHLLQLLVLRRLMHEGHGATPLQKILRGRDDDALEALLLGTATLDVQPGNPALEYLQNLRATPPPSALLGIVPRPTPQAPLFESPPDAKPERPERYVRFFVQPGLELHVGPDFQLPKTRTERDRLADALLAALDTLRRTKP
ncbi:MerR family transcriptional regulator [Deinococcus yavapaiensis]|uniref:MerR-like DNA binding protein n=1 Tax=Deinococcus yavapaiensis KR-236 TaxID=694435 RepID=A0A318S3S8_9DEIO|nr:MerR family transcriptional regulator [Deinococcus yavapaiensis]PYE51019.1 MerR-like DNA binding protein [Deinococcus yavapaiensis KR-236]